MRYRDARRSYWLRRLSRVRSVYTATGPNLSQVSMNGVSTDGAIQGEIKTHLVGTDDVVRAYYKIKFKLLKDVEYNTLAFFQVAADNYSDNLFQKFSYGNANGVVATRSYQNHKTRGYAFSSD